MASCFNRADLIDKTHRTPDEGRFVVIALARELAAQVTEKDDRDLLLKDLDSI